MKGINFTKPMFHSVIDGSKTQTRRIIKPQPDFGKDCDDETVSMFCVGYHEEGYGVFDVNRLIKPRYKIGEILYLKEPYKIELIGGKYKVTFAFSDIVADLPQSVSPEGILKVQNLMRKSKTGYCNKLFVVKGLSEYFPHKIEITGVKAERLQDISESDAKAEGIICDGSGESFRFYFQGSKYTYPTPQQAYAALIDSIRKGAWERNEFYWTYEFKLVKQ